MNFTMYSTPWCGYCYRLKGQLKRVTRLPGPVNNSG